MSAARSAGFGSSINYMTSGMAPRSSLLTMNAATMDSVKVEGATGTAPKDGWADFAFYTSKYDKDGPTGYEFKEELMKNAKALATPGRGILASDESNNTCGQRLIGIGLENSEEMRRKWRECLYSTPDLGKYCSGVIMYDETAR